MTIIFGTLGFTPQKLLPSVSSHENVHKLVFYHDRHPDSQKAAQTVREFCHARGLAVEGVELDAFDIIECARRMRTDLRREGADEAVFNITGGTAVISSAATLASILEGVRAVYIDERNGREVSLPLLSIRYHEVLNREQRRVLRLVANSEDGSTQAEIARALKLSPGTVSHHVKNLKKKRLVRAEKHPLDSRREILRIMESATLLLMEEEN